MMPIPIRDYIRDTMRGDVRDAELEQRIADVKSELLAATTREERIAHAAEMRDLINRRSARQIAKMELDRGLV